MIQCIYPYRCSDDGVYKLNDFVELLLRKVKYADLELEGKALFHHCLHNSTAVLVLNTESVIDVRTKCGIGELVLAEVQMSNLNVASYLPYKIGESLINGFKEARYQHNS
jgi:hypothetical protein